MCNTGRSDDMYSQEVAFPASSCAGDRISVGGTQELSSHILKSASDPFQRGFRERLESLVFLFGAMDKNHSQPPSDVTSPCPGPRHGPCAHLCRGEQSQQSPCWEPGGGFVRLGGMEMAERGEGEETAAREPRPPAMESCTFAPLTEVGWSLALCVFDECGWCKLSVKIKVVAEVRVHVDGRGGGRQVGFGVEVVQVDVTCV